MDIIKYDSWKATIYRMDTPFPFRPPLFFTTPPVTSRVRREPTWDRGSGS